MIFTEGDSYIFTSRGVPLVNAPVDKCSIFLCYFYKPFKITV